jgi:hypothetical protein
MSDTKLRDLERRWRETGAVGDEAAYLLERVRVGDLSRQRLELAAYCGHDPLALNRSLAWPPPSLLPWVRGLVPWGRGVWVVAALTAARVAVRQRGWELPESLAAAQEWLDEPSADRAWRALQHGPDSVFGAVARAAGDLRSDVALRECEAAVQEAIAHVTEGGFSELEAERMIGSFLRNAIVDFALARGRGS